MPKESAGLLLYRYQDDGLRILLGHMGGPQYTNRHLGTWTVPKGGPEAGESLLDAAFREFEEEVGVRPEGRPFPLTSIVQRSGKRVHVWAMEGNINVESLRSNTYELEWPPNSGQFQQHPELDRIAWLTVQEACHLAIDGQAPLFNELKRILGLLTPGGIHPIALSVILPHVYRPPHQLFEKRQDLFPVLCTGAGVPHVQHIPVIVLQHG